MSSKKILTIDGGGLQALTTLSILNDVCKAIGKNSGTNRVPAPYELFDIIGGIGTGGWLALLLGRFRLDIMTCMSVYMEIANAIDPQSALKTTCKKSSSGYRLDQKHLMAKIDEVLERYGLDKNLLDGNLDAEATIAVSDAEDTAESTPWVRCKYVFAAGVLQKSASKEDREYRMFRTYVSQPAPGDSSKYYHAGPDPATCKISEACAATGAAQYFLKPSKISGTSYFDAYFPHPHKVSSLALDEAYSLFGKGVALSLILNVGPSIANDIDVEQLKASSSGRIMRIARKFSWPKITVWSDTSATLTEGNLAATGGNTATQTRTNTSSSLAASDTETKLQLGIKDRLMKEYPQDGDRLYHHIGPVERFAESRLSLNDVSALDLSNTEVEKFRASSQAASAIEEAAKQYLWEAASAA